MSAASVRTSYVVATAGHVDHGKSTLVRALTGQEPDRWAEEQRRGLTIDLGFAHLPLGDADVSFVDVPGHERFIANLLAGLGPAPVVCLVVAADGGWSAQTSEHRDAIAALGIEHGLVAITRCDLADPRGTEDQVRVELAATGLAEAPIVPVSATTGAGLDELRATLADALRRAATPRTDGRVRLWVDRSFSITGAGTVVTGTLAAGTVRIGDRVEVGGQLVSVRGLQSHGSPRDEVGPTTRVAVNLRGVETSMVSRGDALLTPGAWPHARTLDVSCEHERMPEQVTVHVGTAAVSARLRPLGLGHARVRLDRPLPLVRGDRLVLRDPGTRAIAGATCLDVEPPELRRRGDARRRADVLAAGDLTAEVSRRGLVQPAELRRLGWEVGEQAPPGARIVDGWWVTETAYAGWVRELSTLVRSDRAARPLSAGVPLTDAARRLGLPGPAWVEPVAAEAGLSVHGGRVSEPGGETLGPAEAAVAEVERRLAASPFAVPEADDLATLGLGSRELAAAARAGRLLRLAEGVVVLPDAPVRAMRMLSGLDQPFTTSAARVALDTTRRVAVPLLEHLDARGWTRRVDGHLRIVVGPSTGRQ